MENAIRHHLHRSILDKKKLSGGLSFETWQVTLEDGERYVFRTAEDYLNAGNRMIVAGEIFRREHFFYDTLNRSMTRIFPDICVIDESRKYFNQAFQIYKWVEGIPLYEIFEDLKESEKKRIHYQLGHYVGQMHRTLIDPGHAWIHERGPWPDYMAGRLEERLLPLMGNRLISADEIRTLKSAVRSFETNDALSFLHLDIRFHNIIYHNGELFIIDAENAEWGDPRFEWARLALNDMLTEEFTAGYFETTGKRSQELTTGPFLLYQMEVTALVLNVYLNELTGYEETAEKYLEKFHALKAELI